MSRHEDRFKDSSVFCKNLYLSFFIISSWFRSLLLSWLFIIFKLFSIYANKLDKEKHSGICWYHAFLATGSIAVFGDNDQSSNFTKIHVLDSNIPTFDYFSYTDFNLIWFSSFLRCIKNSTIGKFTDEVGNYCVSWLSSSSIFTLLN